MNKNLKSFLLSLVLIMLLSLLTACQETPNDTEMTDGTDVTDVSEPELYVVPINIEFPELSYPCVYEELTVFENKIAIEKYLDRCFDIISTGVTPVKMEIFDWYDLRPSLDGNYVKLHSDYKKAKIDVVLAKQKYNDLPTGENAKKYADCILTLQSIAQEINDYPQKVEMQKLSEIAEHFEVMGVNCEVNDKMICVSISREQLLTLSDTRFPFFIVYDNRIDEIG